MEDDDIPQSFPSGIGDSNLGLPCNDDSLWGDLSNMPTLFAMISLQIQRMLIGLH